MPFQVTAIGTNTSTSGATVAVTVGAAGVPAGSYIIVVVTEKNTAGTNGSMADSAGNSYVTAFTSNLAATAADGRGLVFTVFNSKALVNANTITYTKQLSGSTCAMSAIYVTNAGVAAGDPGDAATAATATGTTGTITVTSGTPGTVEELFVGMFCDSGTSTAGGNATFTQAAGFLPSAGFEAKTAGSGNARVDMGYKQQIGAKATVTYNPSLSSTAQQWALFILGLVIVPIPSAYQEDILDQNKIIEVIGYRCV